MREVTTAVQHTAILTSADVDLAALGAHHLFLVVGVHCRFAALAARHRREAAGTAAAAAGLLLLALDGEGAVRLHVGGLVALNLHAIVALFAGRRVPGARGAEDADQHQQPDHRLAARALLLLRSDLDDVFLALGELSRALRVLGELRELGPLADGGVAPVEAVDQPIVFQERLRIDVAHQLDGGERTVIHPVLLDEVTRPRVALELGLELGKVRGLGGRRTVGSLRLLRRG